jgi:hypothetical protein
VFVYLDENGDTGFKFNQGSTRYFVVTLLLTSDPIPLNAAIDDLRESLNFQSRHEFKFYNSEDTVRRQFLQQLTRHELLIRSLIVDKTQLTTPQMHNRELFYNFLLKNILQYDNGRIVNATLILDERDKGKKSKQALSTYLRQQLNVSLPNTQRKIAAVRYHQSHRDNLIQAVDMASGAIYTHYTHRKSEYLDIIRPKVDDLWEFRASY